MYYISFIITTDLCIKNNTVDAAVDSFTNGILRAMNLANSGSAFANPKSPHRFISSLRCYIF
jgi:hypothetical protein